MKQLRILLVILLVLSIALNAVSYFYRHRVLDITAPVITTDREVLELEVGAEPEAVFEGLTATDAREGDLTDKIMVDHVSHLIDTGTVRVTYVVFDSADNFSKLTRTLRYTDYEPPHFEIREPLVFSVGQNVYVGGKIRAVDVLDGDISSNLQISTQDLNINQPGLYTLNVQATNSLGDTVSMPLQLLMVQGNMLPEIKLTQYLVHVAEGSRFNPREYISSVSDPVVESGEQTLTTGSVHVIGSVNTKVPGTYYVQYYAYGTNGAGYTMLTVVVDEA